MSFSCMVGYRTTTTQHPLFGQFLSAVATTSGAVQAPQAPGLTTLPASSEAASGACSSSREAAMVGMRSMALDGITFLGFFGSVICYVFPCPLY
jgi:hypothetical protein